MSIVDASNKQSPMYTKSSLDIQNRIPSIRFKIHRLRSSLR